MDKVWLLKMTEYEGQCTGFSSYETLLAVFTKKPSVKQLAPYIKSFHLSSEMGEAISQVMTLHSKETYAPNQSFDYDLEEVPVNTPLVKE